MGTPERGLPYRSPFLHLVSRRVSCVRAALPLISQHING